MPTYPALVIDAVSKAVTPSPFEMDRFTPQRVEMVRLTVVNTDGAQTLNVYLEARARAGTGTWCRHSTTSFDAIGPGEGRDEAVSVAGSGEIRVMGTASGAGLTATYTRKQLYQGLT